MTHDPLCGLSQPCDDEIPEHGYCSMQHGEFCIHCHQWCICDVIAKVRAEATAAAVQRVEALADGKRASVDWHWDYEADSTGMTRSAWVLMREVTAAIKGDSNA